MEFRSAIKKSDEISVELDKISDALGGNSDDLDLEQLKSSVARLNTISIELLNMTEISDKFLIKSKWKDPITKESRFGPKMIENIKIFGEKVVLLKERVGGMLATTRPLLESKHRVLEQAEALKKKAQMDEEILFAKAREEALEAEARRLELVQKEEMMQKQKLQEKAESARERQKMEAVEKLAAEKAIYDGICVDAARLNAMSKNMTAFRNATEILRQSTIGRNTGTATLVDILENIMNKPDEEKFRRIRINSEVLKQRLLDTEGGVESLMACGFRAIVDKPDDDSYNNAAIILTMGEPNPETNLDEWMQWHDDLKARKEYLQAN